MFIQKTDLLSHIRSENIDKITRTNDALVDDAINSAVSEARSYLSRYDTIALFGSLDGTVAPTFTDIMLQRKVKDIAAWNLITVCNVNIDWDAFDTKYRQAIAYLTKIQEGKAEPAGWPVYDASNDAANIGDTVQVMFNTKRNNNY